MNAIEIKSLSKKFKGFKAVSNLSITIAENRVMGFLGPNGAGKTTTIRMLAGLSRPTSGQIKICDKEIVFGKSDTNTLFGYLPEQPAFYNWMTGTEYLSFIADTFGLSKTLKKKRVSELFALVGLTIAKNKKIGTYSNGMKQRLGIAQALINDPKVLIMDEPVSALDPIGRREILTLIERLKKDKTIFLSTHILSDVDRICDDVAIINKGKIITVSSLAELKSKYSTKILEVEFSGDAEKLLIEIKKQKWVKRVLESNNHLKIWLKNDDDINRNIPLRFLAESDVSVLKYDFNLPEIEDLFVDLIKESK